MLAQSAAVRRVVMLRLAPGEDVIQSLSAACKEQGIQNGAILGGAGSLSRYHVHVVKTTNLPPGNAYFEGEGAHDVLTLTGLIIDGRVHAHITFSNTEKAMGGHVEEGCRVLTFLIAAVAELPEAQMTDWDRMYMR